MIPLRLYAARVKGIPSINRARGNSAGDMDLLSGLIALSVTWICNGLEALKLRKMNCSFNKSEKIAFRVNGFRFVEA